MRKDVVGKLRVFERTPPWMLPRDDHAISKEEQQRFARYPVLQWLKRQGIYWSLEARVLGYLYPGGRCQYGFPTDTAGNLLSNECLINFIAPSGNVIKRNLNFFELYGKVLYTINEN